VPHTADIRIEAWAATREECVAEAVVALVDGFADRTGVHATGARETELGPGPDTDLLVAALDEVIYRLDVDGELVLDATAERLDDRRLRLRLTVGDAAQAEAVGAIPKAVSLHEVRFAGNADGWSCAVTIDV
jgi:SHS2 domain-containing protein